MIISSESRFHDVCDELFRYELSRDGISLHFALADPAARQISLGDKMFPSYLRQDRVLRNQQTETALNALKNLDVSNLDTRVSLSYELVVSSLEASLEGEKYVYFEDPFSSTHGIQNEYPLLLSEYAFRSGEDVCQYLKLLEQTPDYFESMLAFEKERMEAGFFLSEDNADGAIAACDAFAASGELFTQTFSKRLSRLTNAGILTEQEAAAYEAKNNRIVATILLPAFVKLGDDLLILRKEGQKQQSLYHISGGRDYYRYLLKENAGTDKDVDDLKLLLTTDLKENLTALDRLIASADTMALVDIQDPLETLTPAEILEDLKVRMAEAFPMENPEDYPYEVDAVDKSLEPYTAPAYYFTPPMDALDENHIYINERQTMSGLNLYTTLAHEGFPGHLYQSVTTQNAYELADLPMLGRMIGYGGYIEGYATYAEMYSYQYAKDCAKQLTSEDQAKLVESLYDILYYDRRVRLCLYCLLDLKIHGEGQSMEQIATYLDGFGIRDETAVSSIYNYILNEPTTYLKYYVGYLEFLECRQLAIEHWGSRYSEAAFHTFLLEMGPAPFPMIKEAVVSATWNHF